MHNVKGSTSKSKKTAERVIEQLDAIIAEVQYDEIAGDVAGTLLAVTTMLERHADGEAQGIRHSLMSYSHQASDEHHEAMSSTVTLCDAPTFPAYRALEPLPSEWTRIVAVVKEAASMSFAVAKKTKHPAATAIARALVMLEGVASSASTPERDDLHVTYHDHYRPADERYPNSEEMAFIGVMLNRFTPAQRLAEKAAGEKRLAEVVAERAAFLAANPDIANLPEELRRARVEERGGRIRQWQEWVRAENARLDKVTMALLEDMSDEDFEAWFSGEESEGAAS